MSVTYGQLAQERVWQDERIPSGIRILRAALIAHYGWLPDMIGTVGDQHHLNGYHRSRAWIHHSQYCTNRSYSVSETEGNKSGGSDNSVAAMDLMMGETSAAEICARLRRGKALGKLPYVREIKQEFNASHVHVAIDRGAVDGDLSALFDWITGSAHEGKKMVQVHCSMPELRQGVEDGSVKTAQTLANLRGANLKVDGVFGALTDAAVRQIQTRYGAESVDGVIGPETWTILLAGEDQD